MSFKEKNDNFNYGKLFSEFILFFYKTKSAMKFNIITISNIHHSFLVSLLLFCAYIIPNRISNSIIIMINIFFSIHFLFYIEKYNYLYKVLDNDMIWGWIF